MKRRDLIPHVVFLGPASVLFLLAVVIPFGVSVFYSLTDWNGIGKTYQFVGLKNYIDVFSGRSQFLHSAKFTILLGLAVVVLTNVLGVALAALLSNSFRGSGLFRAVFFLPNTMGGVVMGYIWRFLFLMVVGALGTVFSWEILQLPWLGTPGTAYAALIIVSVWQGAGYVMIIMIAALTGIPQELEEAATIDGANGWKTFWRITVPLLKPTIIMTVITSINGTLQLFDESVNLTKGGPANTTITMSHYVYNTCFINVPNFGYASAMAFLIFIMVAVLALINLKVGDTRD